jgi:hypothetical protein
MSELIRGAGSSGGGKGGGSQYIPTTARDGLDSTQYAQLIDLLSEGEIEGLKDGLKSIYINNTPLQNPNGSFNFQDVAVYTRNGTQSQSIIPLATTIEDEIPVGVTVLQALPVVRTITDPNADAARITITVPQLQRFTDKGDILGSSVQLQIAVQYNGGGFTTVVDDTISGRTGDPYQRDYVITFSAAPPVDIRVTRVTLDSTDPKLSDIFNWTSYTEIVRARLRYPNSALVGLRVDAQQFSNIPQRSYLVRGIKVRIPSNATVDSTTGRLIYAGIWNGTFGAAQWCSDPAWILWDLLTSTRYGFGDHIQAAALDKWAFYSASQYASALVPNGFGGQEPRFSCNVNIQTQEDSYKLINDLSSVFRAMPYWSTGALTISQDKPADPAYLFTLANVSEEGFNYQGSAQKTRPTVAVVSYLDLDTREIAYEEVEDQAAIAKYGVVTIQMSAFACTSRGQAARMGEWLLYAEQYEGEVISFTTSIDAGVLVRPGQVIEVADPVRVGSRRGGRISAATTTTITVDDATGLTIGSSATLSVILPDGSVESRGVSAIAGNVITLATALSAAPNANSVWIFQTSDIEASTWRVLAVQEQDGCKYLVNALAYDASKYDYIERDRPLQPRDTSNLNEIPPAPTNLQAVEALYESQGRALAKLIVSWQPVVGIGEYRVRWRVQDGNWTSTTQARPDHEILDTTAGTYEVQVYSLNAALRQSTEPAKLTVQAYGKTAPPAAVTGVSLIPIDGASAILSWDRSLELDVVLGGKVLIRHNVAMVGAVWEESQEIVSAVAGSQTQKQVPLLEGTYLLKFEDDTGNRSATANATVVDLPTPQPRLLVQSYREDQEIPPFSGNLTDMFYSAELDGLVLSTGEDVDDMAVDGNWDGLGTIDGIGGVLEEGEYEFGSTLDLGGIFDLNMIRYFTTRPYLPGSLWDDKLSEIDNWPQIDENNLDGVNALLYVRTTEDNPSASPTWGAWREFSNAITRGRGFQFKTIATSSDPTQNIIIDELGCQLELQQRTEQSATLTTSTATYSVVFANAFYQPPSVGITGFNMVTGDYFTIASVTRTGFQVTFRNSAGNAVSRQFTYTAIGFGREI